jgi:hypothetical protein
MFAASPGLHGVEHPIYDIWLTDCKGPNHPRQRSPDRTPEACGTAAAGAKARTAKAGSSVRRRLRSPSSSSSRNRRSNPAVCSGFSGSSHDQVNPPLRPKSPGRADFLHEPLHGRADITVLGI